MSFFSKSGPKKKDLLQQIQLLTQQLNDSKKDLLRQSEQLTQQLDDSKKGLVRQIEQLTQQLNNSKKDLENSKNELEDSKKKIQELEQGYFGQFDRNVPGVSTTDFYDGVIDIPNLRTLMKGWAIYIKDWTEYRKLVQRQGVVVSIVGNYGKGKTFLLGLLSDQYTPHGFNVNTQGVSIMYLRDKKGQEVRPIIVLDTKGGSLPLNVSADETRNIGETRVGDTISEAVREEENRFKQILRDHDATEDVLQNFIMEEANIILIVVSDLTFPDQRLISKITSKFKEHESKKILVVHNLYHAKTKQDVQNKLEEFILPSFKLSANEFSEFESGKNHEYYVQKGPKNTLIHHLILAKQGTEAGIFYNDMTIKHIRGCIGACGFSKSIDVIQSFYVYLKRSLLSYIQTTPELELDDIKLDKSGNEQPMRIIMVPKQSFEVKAVMTDELGHLRIFKDSDNFQPKYCLFEDIDSETERHLCMKVECPDTLTGIKYRVIQNTDEFSIQVRGTKPGNTNVTENVLTDTREFGSFFVETDMYKKAKYRFDYDSITEEPQITYVNGMAILRWKLRPVGEAWHSAEDVQVGSVRMSPFLKNKNAVTL